MGIRIDKAMTSLVLLALCGVAGHAQSRRHLVPPSEAERAALEKKLDPALMPAGASHRNIDPKQIFKLIGPHGTEELALAAVDFDVPNPNAGTGISRHTCGIYVAPVQGTAYFLDGSLDEALPVQCWKVVSIRVVRQDAEPAEIMFVGEASLASHLWRQEYFIHRGEDGTYKLTADYKDAPQKQ
ncbi:hypothetical protein [Terriglobus albidus]|uniref:hypothetical protein n=1 Tax=Terriglobus albidus TaxID=1592106 RepID=UPI0021DFDE9D|nr:hypothetical protein [Terriglobus albidus]